MRKSFGETVRLQREMNGLTLKEVSEKLGIDISMLGKIEKNTRKPTKVLIEKFSIFFNVRKKDLIISSLSDNVAFEIMDEEFAIEILKEAEIKVKYLQQDRNKE